MESGRALHSVRAAIRLPPLVSHSTFKLVYWVYWAPFIAVYQLVNRHPLVQPVEFPFTWLDRAIPFLPQLLPVYVSYLPLYWWTVSRLENDREVNRAFYAAYLQLLLCLPFFVFFPVRMPRETFYGSELYNWADAFWRWFDGPNNCFPSLHVSSCLLLLQFSWPRPHRWAVAVALGAVIASTVLVKQHYVVDVVGGGLVYLASRWFLARLEVVGLSASGWKQDRELVRSEG